MGAMQRLTGRDNNWIKSFLAFLLLAVASSFTTTAGAAVVIHDGTLSADETWVRTDIHVIETGVSVPVDVTLTIQSGAIIKFKTTAYLYIYGTLLAAGTVTEKITFTSYKDDYGGNTNGDVTGIVANNGDWGGIEFRGASELSEISYIEVRFGGAGAYNDTAVQVAGTSPTLANILVENSAGVGVKIANTAALLRDSVVRNNDGDGILIGSVSSNPELTGNTIKDNAGIGVNVVGDSKPILDFNIIEGNTSYGVYYASTITIAPPLTNNTIRLNGWAMQVPLSVVPSSTDNNNISANINNHIVVTGSSSTHTTRNLKLSHKDVYLMYGTMFFDHDLIISPGVIIKIASRGNIYIGGSSTIVGTENERIIITSAKDDSAGGATNGQTNPTSGYWYGVNLGGGSLDIHRMAYTDIRYGGYNGVGLLDIRNGSVEAANNIIQESSGHGIKITPTNYLQNVTVAGNLIKNNSLTGITTVGTTAIKPITINNNTIDYNRDGLSLSTARTTVDSNTITNSTLYGLSMNAPLNSTPSYNIIPSNNVIQNNRFAVNTSFWYILSKADNNLISANTSNVVKVTGGSLDNRNITLSSQVDYDIGADITINANASLTLEPGVKMKFSSIAGLTNNGILIADGLAENPVVFTSINDDSYGGDTNENGNATIPGNGDWDGIIFTSTAPAAASLLRYAHIKYGGGAGIAGLDLSTDVLVENSVISNSISHGIRVNAVSPVLSGNSIWGNSGSGVIVEGAATPTLNLNQISTNNVDGITIGTGVNAVVNNNQIYLNREYGLRNNGTNVIDATDNWWGDSDPLGAGPYHATSNISGTGDDVSDNVTYSPYKTTVETALTYINFKDPADTTFGSMTAASLLQGSRSNLWDDTLLRPDRTVVKDPAFVHVRYTGLDPIKNYKLRVSYYNGDAVNNSLQSLTNESGSPVHDVWPIAAAADPVQYEVNIPKAYYSTNTLELKFVRDTLTPSPSTDAAVSEIWLLEDIDNANTSKLEVVEFNDVDASGDLSPGDEYHFRFSTPMDTSLTPIADTSLFPEGKSYGSTNMVSWADNQTLIVTVNAGVTITGSERVTATGMLDAALATVTGSQRLNLIDTISPALIAIDWVDVDADTYLSTRDQYVFHFNEVMDSTTLVSDTVDANNHLPPAGGRRYGDTNIIGWSVENKSVTVTTTAGRSILGGESVTVTTGVTDVAGNSATGTWELAGIDPQPLINSVVYDDLNANGILDVGDRYVFTFSEPMDRSSLQGNSDANQNLPPFKTGQSISDIYGTSNQIVWNADATAVSIYITSGYSIDGTETVSPTASVTDAAGNSLANTGSLNLIDAIGPELVIAQGSVASPVPPTTDYRVVVQFNGSVDTAAAPLIAIVTSDDLNNPVVPVGGTWSSNIHPNDTYTTLGITLSRDMAGPLRVNISGAQDTSTPTANIMTEVFGVYEIYVQAVAPVITSHDIAPAVNGTKLSGITLVGTREPNTSIWINDEELVVAGADINWSGSYGLAEGMNELVVLAKDSVGIPSESVSVIFNVDTIAPVVGKIVAGQIFKSFTGSVSISNILPATITIEFIESGSNLNLGVSTLSLSRGAAISGNWVESPGLLTFTPDSLFVEGEYQLNVKLVDNLGNASALTSFAFTIDQTPPAAPVLDLEPIPQVTNINVQRITGTKEAGTHIWESGGNLAVSMNYETIWAYDATLSVGPNTLSFTAKDIAGNESTPAVVTITYDNTAPPPITALELKSDGTGDGLSINLNWSDYSEVASGNDINYYTIYLSTTALFSNISGATEVGTVPGGTQTYTLTGLTRNTTYYIAVAPTDTLGNADPNVNSVSVLTEDNIAPEEVTNVTVDSTDTSLKFIWTGSANSSVDLTGYNFYFYDNVDNNPTPITLPATDINYQITGLTAATSYASKITTVDATGNESAGVTTTGVTLLPHPTNLLVTPLDAKVDLSWTAAQPPGLVQKYAVYISDISFTDVTNMPRTVLVNAETTTASVAGLTNDVTYHVAVTTINLSGGENKLVTTDNFIPVADTAGPVFASLKFNGAVLTEGGTVAQPGDITVEADDPAGVSRVEFSINDVSLGTDANGSINYAMFWNLYDYANSPPSYNLSITAYDTLGNSTNTSLNANVSLAAPPVPVITSPLDGYETNQVQVEIKGTAQAGSTVSIYKDGVTKLAEPVATDSNGQFNLSVTLPVDGPNSLQALASNNRGGDTFSTSLIVNLDTSVPEAPIGFQAKSKASGLVQLTWNSSEDKRINQYNLYRATLPFTNITDAGVAKVNSLVLTTAGYKDIPATDGTYHYRVVAVNSAGTSSLPSVQVTGIADSLLPQATSIVYTPLGNHDAASGRTAPGQVNVKVTVSEPLQATPFLSITPGGGLPMIVDLTPGTSKEEYAGSFTIGSSAPSGAAWAVFSAHDEVGNRGTEVLTGTSILIDTVGPSVSQLLIAPVAPIKSDSVYPATITFDATLDGAVKEGTDPQFKYLLSGTGRSLTPVANLVKTGDFTYRGSFTLPLDAGAIGGINVAENLTLKFSALDDLDNLGNLISASNQFQVYQGDLPPVDVPVITGEVLPGRQIRLSWGAVEGAVDYEVYRQAPGDTETQFVAVTTGATVFTETTASDGIYFYNVASVRTANGETAISGKSNKVELNADSLAPGQPMNLDLILVGAGIKATWNAPTLNTESLTYNIYRGPGLTLDDITGLEPIQSGIVETAGVLSYIDTLPDKDKAAYAVAAVDEAGNISAPSISDYLSVDLLPVATLSVEKVDDQLPLLSWSHQIPSSIAGYDVYIGESSTVPVNTTLLPGPDFEDTGYVGDTRHYKVMAVDGVPANSLGRTVVLPQLSASLDANATLKRGIMNRLDYTVVNNGAAPVNGIVLKVLLKVSVDKTYEHQSAPFNLLANESLVVPVIIGGFNDLPDISSLETRLEVRPDSGEIASLVRNSQILVNDSVLVLGIESRNLTRGTNGEFRFTLDNSSQVETEIVTALTSGTLASTDIRLQILDADENVLSSEPFRQATGNNVITLSSGTTVARLPAGERFVSDWFLVPIPSSAPDKVIAKLIIDSFHYHLGKTDTVSIPGMSSRKDLTLKDTLYTGSVTSALPGSSYGDAPIVISGQAVDRSTGLPLSEVPLNLIVSVKGFERSAEIYTDASGNYSYSFEPLPKEGGIYSVSALHPDEISRPEQAQFTINKVLVQPSTLNLYMVYGFPETVDVVNATTGDGTTVNNLRLQYINTDQTDDLFPAGVTIDIPNTTLTLAPNQSGNLSFDILAASAVQGQLILRVVSDESPLEPLSLITVNYNFSTAEPVLSALPTIIVTGVAQDNYVTEILTLKNKGLADITDVSVSLVYENGDPAPEWIYLTSNADQGTITIGEGREISLQAAPSATISPGINTFLLRVTGSNYTKTMDIVVSVAVTLSGEGNARFKVSDIYTGAEIPFSDPLAYYQGVEGATVRIQNEDVISIDHTLLSDHLGEVSFENLATGRYRYRISAPSHQDSVGRFSVKAGVTHSESILLGYDLVTIEWSLTETTVTDSYQINIEATYETDVPAAVVVFEPASVTLPEMAPGDVYNGELTLTNYGLFRADNLKLTQPPEDQYFRYEFFADLPASLAAKESVVIPFRAISLQSVDPTGTSGTGGIMCQTTYTTVTDVDYSFECINGFEENSMTTTTIKTANNTCVQEEDDSIMVPVVPNTIQGVYSGSTYDSTLEVTEPTVTVVPTPLPSGASCPDSCPGGVSDCADGNEDGDGGAPCPN